MSIFQFPKHILDKLPLLLPYLEGISDVTSPSYTFTSSTFKIPTQTLNQIPKELLHLVPYFEKVDHDMMWLLPYSKDFTSEDPSPSRISAPSAPQRREHVHCDSSDSEEDISSDDDSSDDSDSSSGSEDQDQDEFYDCSMELDPGYNTKGHSEESRLYDDDTDSEMSDPESSSDNYVDAHSDIVSESEEDESSSEEDDASFAPGPSRAANPPAPVRTVKTVQAPQNRRIAPLPRRSTTSPQSTATPYLPPTARTTRKNYAELEGSDEEDAGDDEFVPEKSSGPGKRKNTATSRGRRVKTSRASTSSSGSSSHSPAPTLSSYDSPTPSSAPSPSGSSSSSTSSSSSSRSSTKSKSSGQQSTSGRAPKRARTAKKAPASTQSVPNASRNRHRQVNYDLVKDYDSRHPPIVWDAKGKAPCVISGCTYRVTAGRHTDNRRHWSAHSKAFYLAQSGGKPALVCSEQLDEVLERHPEYRLLVTGISTWGCNNSFSRPDALLRHIQAGTCAR